MQLSEKNIEAIKALCIKHRVKDLFAFGSITRDDFKKESDIDLLVDFNENDPLKYSDLYFNLKEKLEVLLKRKIDLLESRAIKNQFLRKELDETKVRIYGQ